MMRCQSLVVELTNNRIELVKSEALTRASLVIHMGAVHHLQKIIIIDPILQVLCNSLLLEIIS